MPLRLKFTAEDSAPSTPPRRSLGGRIRGRARRAGTLAFFALALPRAAQAGPEEAARAESLFRSGKEAYQRGDLATACPQLAESQRLEPAGGTLLALALCYEAWGKNATAWALFQEAEVVAHNQGRRDRAAIASEHAAALEAGLSFLTLELDPAMPARVEVSLDGLAVGAAARSARTAVDSGTHRVEARHQGRTFFDRTFGVSPKQHVFVHVPLPAEPAEPSAAAAPRPEARRSEARVSPEPRSSFERALPRVMFGVGLAALLAGGYFGVRAYAENRDVERSCPEDPCHPSLQADQEAARRDAAISTWLLGAGLATTGIGLYWTWRSESRETGGLTPRAAAGAREGRIIIRGEF